jgi:hypothetical protein
VSAEQRIRAFLFYLSVAIFLVGLPMILSFSLSYKFNTRTLRFTKTGLIDLKTQPPGAGIYLNDELLNDKTPTTINELLPGSYSVRLELKGHYPWFSEVTVNAGKVTRLEKIILFPLRPDIKQISQERASSFRVEKDKIYYINEDTRAIYSSDLEGDHFKEIGLFPEMDPPARKYKVSWDREKALFFNSHQIAVVFLEPRRRGLDNELPILMDFSNHRILDAFWYSDNYHLILVTDRAVEALEAKPDAKPVSLVTLNKRNTSVFYDESSDTLYFVDSQKAVDGKFYDNVYKLDLGAKFNPFSDLMNRKTNEERSPQN